MATSFEKVRDQGLQEAEKGSKDQSKLSRNLDSKQRRALELFQAAREIAAKDIAGLFGHRPRTAALRTGAVLVRPCSPIAASAPISDSAPDTPIAGANPSANALGEA